MAVYIILLDRLIGQRGLYYDGRQGPVLSAGTAGAFIPPSSDRITEFVVVILV